MSDKTKTREQSINPKTVNLSTYLLSLTIAILITGVSGAIFGYFASVNVHSEARQSVVQDMSVLSSKTSR